MARKKKEAGGLNGSNAKGKGILVELVPVKSEKTIETYCNYINVAHSPWDFSMACGLFTPHRGSIPKSLVEKKMVEVPIELEIKVPVNLVPALIRALEDQKSKYEESFGPIIEPGQKPRRKR